MYIALLVRVTALSVMSRIGNVLHRHPVFASAMDVIDEMYETIRLEHQRYSHLPLLRFPQGIVAITTTTSTAASSTSTPSTPITTTTATTPTTTASLDSATYTTTPYGTGSVTAVVGPSTSKPPRECDWHIVYNLGKVLEAPYNLTSKAETTALRDAVSKARTSRRTLERLAETRPKQAGPANALGEVLDYLVSEPLESACEAVLTLQHRLLQPTESGRNEGDAAELRALFDRTLVTLSHPDLDTRAHPRPVVLSASAEEALSAVFAERWGDARYCVRDDCDWVVRVFDMWQAAQAMRETLTAGLLDAKAQALLSFADKSEKRSLSSILHEMAWLMPVCVIFMVMARLAAPGPVR